MVTRGLRGGHLIRKRVCRNTWRKKSHGTPQIWFGRLFSEFWVPCCRGCMQEGMQEQWNEDFYITNLAFEGSKNESNYEIRISGWCLSTGVKWWKVLIINRHGERITMAMLGSQQHCRSCWSFVPVSVKPSSSVRTMGSVPFCDCTQVGRFKNMYPPINYIIWKMVLAFPKILKIVHLLIVQCSMLAKFKGGGLPHRTPPKELTGWRVPGFHPGRLIGDGAAASSPKSLWTHRSEAGWI